MAGGEKPDHKDFWDKLQIILAPLGGLLTASAVAMLGFMGSRAIDRQQSNEAKLRLYSELMSRREESESTLRKEMFQSIIGSFFDNGSVARCAAAEDGVAGAELPRGAQPHAALSAHAARHRAELQVSVAERRDYEDRLVELAREVTRKQLIVLEAGGHRTNYTVIFSDSLLQGKKTETLDDAELSLDGIKRRFRTTVFKVDTIQRTPTWVSKSRRRSSRACPSCRRDVTPWSSTSASSAHR
jgi:hypothetical protein